MAHVAIQLGHCYRKTGATGTNGVDGDPNEQEFATAAGWRAAELLQQAGHTVGILLADDPISYYGGDAFVAIHCDGSVSSDARGASVGYRTSEGQAFATAWKRHYAAAGWSGFRPDNYTSALAGYYGTRNAVAQGNRTAFIAEAGFLTSPTDEALLTPPDGADRFARALTNAVVDLFGGQPTEEDPLAGITIADIEAAAYRGNVKALNEATAFGTRSGAETIRQTLVNTQALVNAVAALAARPPSDVDEDVIVAELRDVLGLEIARQAADEFHARLAS